MVTTASTVDTLHEDMIHDAQLDYYGKKLVTCSSDKSVKIFDVADDQQTLVQTLNGHDGPVWEVAWAHPKFGNILASCSFDAKVIIWKETPSGWVNVYEHKVHDASVNSIDWAPHEYDKLSLACASADGDISILSCQGEPLGEWSHQKVSQDKCHSTGVTSVSWAPAPVNPPSAAQQQPAMHLVSGGCDNLVKIWSCVGDVWTSSDVLAGHTEWVRDVAWAPSFSGSNGTIASCSQDGTVIIWTQDGGASSQWSKKPLSEFGAPVWRVSWSVTANLLAVSSGESKVTIWKETLDGEWKCVSEQARAGGLE